MQPLRIMRSQEREQISETELETEKLRRVEECRESAMQLARLAALVRLSFN